MKYLCRIPEQNKKDKIIKGQKKLPWQSIYLYIKGETKYYTLVLKILYTNIIKTGFNVR